MNDVIMYVIGISVAVFVAIYGLKFIMRRLDIRKHKQKQEEEAYWRSYFDHHNI